MDPPPPGDAPAQDSTMAAAWQVDSPSGEPSPRPVDGSPGGSPPRPPPHFMAPTAVQPKVVVDDPPHTLSQDRARAAFTQGSFLGIRSLPDALSPDFRQRLYEEIVAGVRAHRDARHSQASLGGGSSGPGGLALLLAATGPGSPVRPSVGGDPAPAVASAIVAAGQRRPGALTGEPLRVFTKFEHLPDDYGREKAMRAAGQRAAKAAWVAPEPFKCSALPPIPAYVGSFNEFEYAVEPYEDGDQTRRAAKVLSDDKVLFGPIRAGGRPVASEQAKARVWELVEGLAASLRRDWPRGFQRLFESETGALVLCFAKTAGDEGDLTTYMNHTARSHRLVQAYGLRKDPARWGLTEAAASNVYYVLVPPWVHMRPSLPESTVPPPPRLLREPALESGRSPYGTAGLASQVAVCGARNWPPPGSMARSFKY